MKVIIVYHYWFVQDLGFEVEILECEDENEAHAHACVEKNRTEKSHRKCAFEIIPIALNEEIADRRLSWWERLSGKLKA